MIKKIVKKLIDIYLTPVLINNSCRAYVCEKLHISFILRSINLLKGKIDKNMCIIDVGAFEGFPGDTTPTFAEAFPDNTIYAFEPFTESYSKLVINMKKYKNVKTFNLALSDKVDKGTLYVSAESHSSSLLQNNDQALDNLKSEYSKAIHSVKKETVDILTLDEFASQSNIGMVGILKIDTQGTELSVLKGGSEVLKNTVLVVAESGNHDVYKNSTKYYELDQYLRENGFILYDYVPSLYEKGRLYEFDAIYVNKEFKHLVNTDETLDKVLSF